MLKRLAEKFPDLITPLTQQYRMNAEICRLSSDAVYNGKLKCASKDVACRRLQLPHFPRSLPHTLSPNQTWISDIVDPSRSVLFVDTDRLLATHPSDRLKSAARNEKESRDVIDALEGKIGGKYDGKVVNETEALLVGLATKALVSCGLPASQIGIISPFKAQVSQVQITTTSCFLPNDGLTNC